MDVSVVFSLMKGKPNSQDVAPGGILAWRSYLDADGVERPVPPHALVTSRNETETGSKNAHYALMCHSDDALELDDLGSFDPSAYRNVSGTGAPVSSSQVTALLLQVSEERLSSGYRINFRARLTGSYWVRLTDPCPVGQWGRAALSRCRGMTELEWLDLVTRIRSDSPTDDGRNTKQSFLFRFE
jgi:hypothetical protein